MQIHSISSSEILRINLKRKILKLKLSGIFKNKLNVKVIVIHKYEYRLLEYLTTYYLFF